VTVEGVAHAFFVAKPAQLCDLVDVALRVFEHSSRRFQAKQLECLGRRAADLAFVDPREIARAHLRLWISENLGDPQLSVESLARQAQMSPRNFARVYKRKIGRTPAKALELFRLEAARRMLEDSQRNIDQIAQLCGFGDEERMRDTFYRHLSVSPREYRSRFSR
jgi:transcriptional regulator GlxA family with amidase domain